MDCSLTQLRSMPPLLSPRLQHRVCRRFDRRSASYKINPQRTARRHHLRSFCRAVAATFAAATCVTIPSTHPSGCVPSRSSGTSSVASSAYLPIAHGATPQTRRLPRPSRSVWLPTGKTALRTLAATIVLWRYADAMTHPASFRSPSPLHDTAPRAMNRLSDGRGSFARSECRYEDHAMRSEFHHRRLPEPASRSSYDRDANLFRSLWHVCQCCQMTPRTRYEEGMAEPAPT